MKSLSDNKFRKLKSRLTLFQMEHRKIQYVVQHCNSRLVSELMMVTFLTNILGNVVMIAKIIFDELLFAEQFLMFLFILIQTILSMQGCIGLISWAEALYKSDRLLYKIQMILSNGNGFGICRSMIKSKLKLMLLYELVCTNDAFRFTLGSSGKISKKSLFEVSATNIL